MGPTDDIARGRLDGDRPDWARQQFVTDVLPTATRDGIWSGESAYRGASGETVPVLKVVLAHRGPDGEVAFYSTIARDISRRKEMEEKLEQQARVLAQANSVLKEQAATDTLTGLANRDHSLELLGMLLSLAKRQGRPLCFAFLDLDHFKEVNDQHGHGNGDVVLRELGRVLRASFRGEDIVSRWGGEEFLVAMFGTVKSDAVRRLQEVLIAFHAQVFNARDGKTFQVTFSAGIAEYPTDGIDVDTLYELADQALYKAKAAGRNRILPVDAPTSASSRPAPVASEVSQNGASRDGKV
jgi:diguanylate cyclase (GGDEF)-like protein